MNTCDQELDLDIDHALEKAAGVALAVTLRCKTERQIRNVAQRCGCLGIVPLTMLEECVLADVLVAVASTGPTGGDTPVHDSPLLKPCWERIAEHAIRYRRRQRK